MPLTVVRWSSPVCGHTASRLSSASRARTTWRSTGRCTAPASGTSRPRHEQGAGYAADGYARTTGRPGVAIVTTGPALLNIAAAVGQAYSDSIPMLVISPGMPLDHVAGTGLLHEAKDQTAALAASRAASHRVTSHAEIGAGHRPGVRRRSRPTDRGRFTWRSRSTC